MVRRRAKKSSSRKSRSRGRDLLLLILIGVVAYQGYLLWIKKEAEPRPRAVVSHRTSSVLIKPEVPGPVPVTSSRPVEGRIAIIIDDSGYNLSDCDQLAAIDAPITISILPNLPHSREIAACAHRQGKEVMLHLPMEPHVNQDHYPDDYIIKTTMSADKVVSKMDEALASVPYVEGINNHMGSKATENSRLMSLVFSYMGRKGLFFVDSRVTTATVCGPLARKKRVLFTQRDIFLDNKNERLYIEGQLAQAVAKAKDRGYAVAIGHARPATWQVLRDATQRLSAEGIEFVPVRRVIQIGQ